LFPVSDIGAKYDRSEDQEYLKQTTFPEQYLDLGGKNCYK